MKYNTSDYNLLAEYYEAHFDELRQFVGSRVNFAYETEDIVQNVFLRLLKSDKMITPITLPCLVYTVARNLIFDYWRHHTRLQEHEHQLQTSSNYKGVERNLGNARKHIRHYMRRMLA